MRRCTSLRTRWWTGSWESRNSSSRLLLVAVLGAVFLKGFREAINLAVVIVGAYLILNLVVVAVGLYLAVTNPASIADWQHKLFATYGNPLVMVGGHFCFSLS
jgi:hypothetical protein